MTAYDQEYVGMTSADTCRLTLFGDFSDGSIVCADGDKLLRCLKLSTSI